MFSVMTWNLENFERPAANADQAVKERYARKLQQISELIISAGPDLVGVQEVLADHKSLAPQVFDDLREALGPEWNGCYPSGPTLAVFGWAGWPAGSCLTPPMSPSTRNGAGHHDRRRRQPDHGDHRRQARGAGGHLDPW
jgi:hypothetical protein